MPEMTFSRTTPTTYPMTCMYCGAPATHKDEWHVDNPRDVRGGGGGDDLSAVPTGDDPVSVVVQILMLPLILWALLKALVAAIGAVAGLRKRAVEPPPKPLPPLNPPSTLVAVTTCERHRRFRDRFVWAGAVMLVALVGVWVWAVVVTRRSMGTEDVGLAVTLVMGAVFGTVLIPVALGAWYSLGGPVIVDRATQDTVVMDRVRQAYFDATGLEPSNPK